jgi:hypothetical protein
MHDLPRLQRDARAVACVIQVAAHAHVAGGDGLDLVARNNPDLIGRHILARSIEPPVAVARDALPADRCLEELALILLGVRLLQQQLKRVILDRRRPDRVRCDTLNGVLATASLTIDTAI